MENKIENLIVEVSNLEINSLEEFEKFKLNYSGKKGILANLFSEFKNIPNAEKKQVGLLLNKLKSIIEEKNNTLKDKFAKKEQEEEIVDLTRPAYGLITGSRHPISLIANQIINIFQRMGFNLSDGPEIVDDFQNFEALNFDADHPARDMQDTFFLSNPENLLLRTHTSSVQVQEMLKNKLPLRTITFGRVYRNETISSRSHCQFHQIEGIYVSEDANFVGLKQVLDLFVKELFGENTKIRFRPSYFPFTEISAEMDISCFICEQKGCSVCKNSGWVEILGCGMIDPQVLENCNIDSEKYQGFAFGLGVERIAMLKYGIKDIRLFFENDANFLKQFHLGLNL